MKRLLQLVTLLGALAWCVPASANITYVGAGAMDSDTTTTDSIAPLPASTATDDILLVYCWVRNTGDTTAVSGYTQVAQVDTSTGSHSLFWKRHDGSEGSATCNKSASADSRARQFAFRGAITSGDPWDALGSFQTTGSEPVSLTGITAGNDGDWIIMFGGYEDDDTASIVVTGTDPAAYTEVYAESATGADGAIVMAYGERTTAGASGTVTVDFNVALSDQFAGILMALQPVSFSIPSTPSAQRLECWGNTEDGASSSTQTLAITPTGGTGHILVSFARSSGGVVTHTLSDNSGSNSWSNLVADVANDDDTDNASMSIAYDIAGGSYTLTDTLSAARTFRGMGACEYDDMASASALDGSATGGVGETSGQQATVTTGTFSTTNANNVIVLMATFTCDSCTPTDGTIAGTTVPGTLTANDSMVYDLDVTSTFSTQSCTAADSTNGWVAICAGLKRAAGGGGGGAATPTLMMMGVGD